MSADFQEKLEEEAAAESHTGYPLPAGLVGKKILVTTESLGPINGVTRATQYLLDYLLARDVQIAALAPDFISPDNSPLRKKIPVIRLPGMPLVYNPDLRMAYPFRLKKVFQRTFRPDVVYVASPAILGLQIWWQLKNAGIPLIANFQTDLAAYSERMLPRPLGRGAAWAINRVSSHVLQSDSFKLILCPSTASRDYLQSLKIPLHKLKLVGRGVDCHFFDWQKRSPELRAQLAPNGEILLLCVSRVSLEKGFDFLAQAFELILQGTAERGMAGKIRLIITGGNSNHTIEQNIKGYFKQFGAAVHFTGALTGEPLARMFASADVFVFPSLTETFGQVVQEAMASGLPVVARREGGPADIVQPGVTGFLPAPTDLKAFADYTLELVQNTELRQQMRVAARRYAQNRSWDAINQQIAGYLAEVL